MTERTILLVDDEPNILKALKRILRTDGYKIYTADGGEEALAFLTDHPVGVIISDHRMPGMTGTELLAIVKDLYPDTIRIVLSGYSDLETITEAINEGSIYKFLCKPWDDAHLRTTIKEAFENYELKMENLRLTQELKEKNLELSQKNVENSGLIELVVTHSCNGIIVVDQYNQVVFSNPAALNMLMYNYRVLPGDEFELPYGVNRRTNTVLQRENKSDLSLSIDCRDIIHEGKAAYLITLFDHSDIDRLYQEKQNSAVKLKETFLQMIKAISLTIEKRDVCTAGHQTKVSNLSVSIAAKMGLDNDALEGLKIAGLVHDIGKIYIPSEILNRPGRLNQYEMQIVREHPQVGYDILESVTFNWPIKEVILQHHECIDGSGYPHGITGAEMMPESKIVAVADVVSAMSEYRPYRDAISIEEIIRFISKHRGVKFDAEVVDACTALLKNMAGVKAPLL